MGGVRNISRDLYRAKAGGGVRVARLSKENAADKPKRSEGRKAASSRALVSSGTPGTPEYEEWDSIWEAIGMSPAEAAYYEGRAQLVIQIREHLRKKKWTQEHAAKACGVSQPRINNLLRGKIDKFSIDALVKVAAHLGLRASFQLKAA